MNFNENFQWERHPKAEKLIDTLLEEACRQNNHIQVLQDELQKRTSTRLFDWLDHVFAKPSLKSDLESVGYIAEDSFYYHPGAQLPRVVLHEEKRGIAVKVERIADYLSVRGLSREIEGDPLTGYRRSLVSDENSTELWVIERRGTWTMEPTTSSSDYQKIYLEAQELWKTRARTSQDESFEMQQALLIAEEMITLVGVDVAAWIVLEVERDYWQARNTAGQLQKNRQDRLGMGWANHDHHTFRSSRKRFRALVQLFELLGFHCRERFYAGEEAGWGAQVMENSKSALVLFLDVDLDPGEIEIDFAHEQLPELKSFGTIGLWCALHGDSILRAGMHHLEAQFFHEQLTEDLDKLGIGMMQPFSDFPYLKQAFTSGEVWQVAKSRLDHLLNENKITQEEAKKFTSYGAVGSHMENLQRRDGYKGFNQKNVSFIIKKTDPRSM